MSKWWDMLFVFRCLFDGGRDGLRRSALSGHWLSCTGYKLYLLSMKLWMYVWDTVFACVQLLRLFLSADYLYDKKRIGKVTPDLLYMNQQEHTYYINDNQQQCSRPSNRFSLRGLGPWMNQLPPVRWSTFRLRFLIVSWCEICIWWKEIFLLISCIYSCFAHYPSFAYHFPLKLTSFQISFLLSTLHWYFP